ncbi:uncharacterized protein LOC116107700 [Pistacia vera]|uniref:uncharacterized protein LOC116107700 n=1 Tax=Pistacia vera TaxID=55513 RepID=UPI001263C5C8|nr:uncharacterized protein LOC116107700 [Pistacia vera]
MSTTRVEITQYNGKIDFGSWRKKMKALLSHNKVSITLEKDSTKWPEENLKKKAEVDEEAYNLIIMNLTDSVLHKVDGFETPIGLWVKLESLYFLQSAPHLAYLKSALFLYKMDSNKTVEENLDEFLKMTLVLKGIDQELNDSSLAMILLNSFTDECQVVNNTLQYIGTVPSVDLIVAGLKARELVQKRSGNSLFVKGKGETSQKHSNTESNLATTKHSIEESEVLTVSKVDTIGEWVDSGCSFHMSPNKNWFQDFEPNDLETVFMGNNNACKVQGVGSITLRLDDGKLVKLTKHRLSFHRGTHQATNCLEYLHANLWEPEKIKSHGGSIYFMSIVDDYSRKVWVFLLRSKNEALERLKSWQTLVKNQVDKKVKALRTDNGLKFCNSEFDRYCSDQGILRHRTVRGTPQQNGVAERMKRTLLEKMRCLLFTSRLPKTFWGEALNTTTYLVTKAPLVQ